MVLEGEVSKTYAPRDILDCTHRGAMACFNAALDAKTDADQNSLNLRAHRFNAKYTYFFTVDFAARTADFQNPVSELTQLVAKLSESVAELEQAVANAKTAAEIARFADDALAIAAGIGGQFAK